ncbi:hypothetical protein RvY_13941 [Ramazzottius varieornatus]|uniref:Cyclin-dependent kinases regulatory subunit n=1 Tax=Ramazzottius varieornatus TaxID=947166 RepID=A0A1D1VUS9_RAMVA|nr:hypothetical protein RvY_13941 [Ramazzottius varieornatus]
MSNNKFYYSDKYNDSEYEYRHVVLPKDMASRVPKSRLMTENEWRGLGIQQSLGWEHYMIHKPEPHIILFRRPLPEDFKREMQMKKDKKREETSGADIMLAGRREKINV